MSEASEEPMVCVDCGGTMTDEDAFSMSLGEYSPGYWHTERSGCIASLGERLAAATKRAEAAEREREAVYVQIECCADEMDILKHEREKWEKRARKLLKGRKALRAERDVLRKDAARYRLLRGLFRHAKWADVDALHELEPDGEKYIADDLLDAALDCVIDAAMEAKV